MKESFLGEIVLKNLKREEIPEFLQIEFDSFYEMMVLIFGGDINGGFKIRKREIEANLYTSKYFVAKVGEEIVGTIEIISQDAIKKYKENLPAFHLYKTMGYKEIKRKSSKMLEKRFLYRE